MEILELEQKISEIKDNIDSLNIEKGRLERTLYIMKSSVLIGDVLYKIFASKEFPNSKFILYSSVSNIVKDGDKEYITYSCIEFLLNNFGNIHCRHCVVSYSSPEEFNEENIFVTREELKSIPNLYSIINGIVSMSDHWIQLTNVNI